MRYNIYIVVGENRKIMRRNVDGETVRKFMSNLKPDEKKYIELERIRDDKDSEERY